MEKKEINIGSDALNDAGWELLNQINQYQAVDGPLFNNLKSCLKAAIEVYLNHEENRE